MEPTDRYPDGYMKIHNEGGQPLNPEGKIASRADMHFPLSPDDPEGPDAPTEELPIDVP